MLLFQMNMHMCMVLEMVLIWFCFAWKNGLQDHDLHVKLESQVGESSDEVKIESQVTESIQKDKLESLNVLKYI